jgi:hypothetical protein
MVEIGDSIGDRGCEEAVDASGAAGRPVLGEGSHLRGQKLGEGEGRGSRRGGRVGGGLGGGVGGDGVGGCGRGRPSCGRRPPSGSDDFPSGGNTPIERVAAGHCRG